jgi:hypothetical protein
MRLPINVMFEPPVDGQFAQLTE